MKKVLHCALYGYHGKRNRSMVPCASQTMKKNIYFPLNQNLTCANYGIYHGWRNHFLSGGQKCTSKRLPYSQRFQLATVTSQALKYDIYAIWRYKLHYFRQNYLTMQTYRWTTWNSNRLLQGQPRSSASQSVSIYSDWLNKSVRRLRHWNFHLLSFWMALSLPCLWR